jgi:3-methyladenine DNA glycosylase AlkD
MKRAKSAAKRSPAKAKPAANAKADANVDDVLAQLQRMGKKSVRDGMARFAIPSDNAVGIAVGDLRAIAKKLGKNHALALALWESPIYEARMLAVFVDDPVEVTPAQMNRWCHDFDSWAICDTACFHLFDRTPHAWRKVDEWAKRKPEFERRAAFALLASMALHDKRTDEDDRYATSLELIEQHATDGRNFVKKAVNWALRAIGNRRGVRDAAIAAAQRLAASDNAIARWNGKDALRELQKNLRKRQ